MAALGSGAAVAGGGAVVTMKDQNGVTVDLVATTQGVKFALGGGGVDMQIQAGWGTSRARAGPASCSPQLDDQLIVSVPETLAYGRHGHAYARRAVGVRGARRG